jgi:hypothetical protein
MYACGGGNTAGNSNATPTAPTPAPVNRNLSISQLAVSPGFGLSQLTSFSMQSAATDPDGDALSYQWELGDGSTATGSSVAAKVFSGNGGTLTVRLTVTDGKGGTVSDTRTITIGSLTGTWVATIQNFARLQLDLQQTGGTVTGRFVQLDAGPNTPAGTNGTTDPAEPGKVDKDGRVEIRLKVGRFLDFYIRGTMDPTGRTITGGLFGSGFTGDAATLVKQ